MGREGADSGELDRLRDVLRRARFFLRHYGRFAETGLRDEFVGQVDSLEAAMTDNILERAREVAAVICRTLLFGPTLACVLFAAETSVAAADPTSGRTIRHQAAHLREQCLRGDPTQVVTQRLLRTGLDEALGKRECDWRNIGELLPETRLREDLRLPWRLSDVSEEGWPQDRRPGGDDRARFLIRWRGEFFGERRLSKLSATDKKLLLRARAKESASTRVRLPIGLVMDDAMESFAVSYNYYDSRKQSVDLDVMLSAQETRLLQAGVLKSAIEALSGLILEQVEQQKQARQSIVEHRKADSEKLSGYEQAQFFSALASEKAVSPEPPTRGALQRKAAIPRHRYWKRSARRVTRSVVLQGRRLARPVRLLETRSLIAVVVKLKSQWLVATLRSRTTFLVTTLERFYKRWSAFISYRRAGGWEPSQLIRVVLQLHRIQVFLDVISLRAGAFPPMLAAAIDQADGIVVVLTPGCIPAGPLTEEDLERDYFCKEILRARYRHKNIVPMKFDSFEFPPEMPEPLEFLTKLQAIQWKPRDHWGAVEKLIRFLRR